MSLCLVYGSVQVWLSLRANTTVRLTKKVCQFLSFNIIRTKYFGPAVKGICGNFREVTVLASSVQEGYSELSPKLTKIKATLSSLYACTDKGPID